MCSRRAAAGLLAALCAAVAPQAAARAPDHGGAAAMLRAADAALHPLDVGVLRVRATVTRPGEGPAVSLADVYVQGADQVLCVFREGPLRDRRILSVGDRTWLIVPGSKRAIPVSAGQRLIGGASIAEVARLRFARDFEASARPADEDVDGTRCAVLDLRARGRGPAYAAGVLWIGRGDGLARRALLSLASGAPAKEVRFTGYRQRRDGPALARMRILHLLPSEQGMETELDLLAFEPGPVDPGLFTPDGARRLS